jgi:hypothetical protein
MERHMSKVTFASVALVALVVFTTQAMAARNEAAARHAAIRAHRGVVECMRAPAVGAFATDPYPVPPCMPNTATETFQ